MIDDKGVFRFPGKTSNIVLRLSSGAHHFFKTNITMESSTKKPSFHFNSSMFASCADNCQVVAFDLYCAFCTLSESARNSSKFFFYETGTSYHTAATIDLVSSNTFSVTRPASPACPRYETILKRAFLSTVAAVSHDPASSGLPPEHGTYHSPTVRSRALRVICRHGSRLATQAG